MLLKYLVTTELQKDNQQLKKREERNLSIDCAGLVVFVANNKESSLINMKNDLQ